MSTRNYKVEFDPAFFGGVYTGQGGNHVLVPEQLVAKVGMSAAFFKTTGHNPANIVHFTEDLRYDAAGLLLTDEPAIELPAEPAIDLAVEETIQLPVQEPIQFPAPAAVEIDEPGQIETETDGAPRTARRRKAA